ncbi:MAG: TetR/AcrR family transcriptional regulator [Trueperaceae bacterium]|nr:TetR/AcrR family transcriptional regulator [Trueperaceae bacterium]
MNNDRDAVERALSDRPLSDPKRIRTRQALLEAASDVVVTKGPNALNLRRVADAVGVSTQMIYTMFGNKEGLLEALLVEGADRLYQRLDSVSDDLSERERLFELG